MSTTTWSVVMSVGAGLAALAVAELADLNQMPWLAAHCQARIVLGRAIPQIRP